MWAELCLQQKICWSPNSWLPVNSVSIQNPAWFHWEEIWSLVSWKPSIKTQCLVYGLGFPLLCAIWPKIAIVSNSSPSFSPFYHCPCSRADFNAYKNFNISCFFMLTSISAYFLFLNQPNSSLSFKIWLQHDLFQEGLSDPPLQTK